MIATRLQEVTARHWQLALHAPGQVVTDLQDVAQCIQIILTTPKGSDPLRPEFGAALQPYIDHPIDQAIPHIVRECWDAISLWEPRVELIRIRPRLGAEPGHLILRVEWRLADSLGEAQATEVAA